MDSTNFFAFDSNIDFAMANALRRTIISRVPSVVVDTVCVELNDSNLCSEMIAHRIGLIPLKRTDPDDTSNLSELDIKLDVVGPKRVYSGDIIFPSELTAVCPDIILLVLEDGQSLKLTGKTEEGNAIDQKHSKFSVSCGKTSYRVLPNGYIHFTVETTGCMTAKNAVLGAIKILKDDLTMYKKML